MRKAVIHSLILLCVFSLILLRGGNHEGPKHEGPKGDGPGGNQEVCSQQPRPECTRG